MCLGVPARVVEVLDEERRLVKVDASGVRREVSVAFTPGARVGDWVLVHVGFALAVIDEEHAQASLALLEEAGEAYARELAEMAGTAEP